MGMTEGPVGENINKKRFMVYPGNNYKELYWDVFQSILLLVTCVLTPFTLAFSEELEVIVWYRQMNNAIDICFALDIILNFNLAYQDEAYAVIDDRMLIAKMYAKTWFLIDFLAVLPFEGIVKLFAQMG